MVLRLAEATANLSVDAVAGQADIGPNPPRLQYTSVPGDYSAPNILADFELDTVSAFEPASRGRAPLAGTPLVDLAPNSGTPVEFRILDGQASPGTVGVGDITGPGGGGDITGPTSIAQDDTVRLTDYALEAPFNSASGASESPVGSSGALSVAHYGAGESRAVPESEGQAGAGTGAELAGLSVLLGPESVGDLRGAESLHGGSSTLLGPESVGGLGTGGEMHQGTGESSSSVSSTGTLSVGAPPVEEGWLDLTPPVGANVFYVSNLGSDSNPGTEAEPFATIGHAILQCTYGQGDQVLLRRGDTWAELVNLRQTISGANATERFVLGAYGPLTDPRPRFVYPGRIVSTTITPATARSHIIISSLEIDGSGRPSFSTAHRGMTIGRGTDIFSDWILEDVWIHDCGSGITFETIIGAGDNVEFRRCCIERNFTEGADAQGFFSQGINFFRVWQCFWNENGWRPGVEQQSTRNHNLYLSSSYSGGTGREVTFEENFNFNASLTGIQMRSGGDCRRNFFHRCPVSVDWALSTSGEPVLGGMTGKVFEENVSLYGNDVAGGARGVLMNAGNIADGVVRDNIAAHEVSSNPIIPVGFASAGDISGVPDVGTHNLTFEDNLSYNHGQGLRWQGATIGPDPGEGPRFTNILSRNNVLVTDNPAATAGIVDQYAISPEFTYDGNQYYHPAANPFRLGGSLISWAQWQTDTGDNGTFLASMPTYTDPNRDITTWLDDVLGTTGSTEEDVYAALRAQRKGNWNPDLEPLNAINHVREGFDKPVLT